MSEENNAALVEMREMLKTLIEEHKQLLECVRELKAEQKKMQDEIRINNFVLNNMTVRSEIRN